MIDLLFFDTDCISAFLWVNSETLLVNLYTTQMIIPKPVYDELSSPGVEHLKFKLDGLINNGHAKVMSIDTGSDAYETYYQLTHAPEMGRVIIGKGESAAIALAQINMGVVASNNLKDVLPTIKQFNLRHLTTADILVEALTRGLIDESTGNEIWRCMLKKRRKLGAATFSDYLLTKKTEEGI